MFDDLESELRSVRIPNFHAVGGRSPDDIADLVRSSTVRLPESYKQFVQRFGGAKLYSKGGYYIVGVLAAPVEGVTPDGEVVYKFGHYQSSDAYFLASELDGGKSPVFEGNEGGFVQVADDFEAWLSDRTYRARRTYSKKEWSSILAGPEPFTPAEQNIIQLRKLFSYRLVGFTEANNALIEVRNGSQGKLPYFSIGVKWDGAAPGTGRVWVPVAHIGPGQADVVERPCYNRIAPRDSIALFSLPDPKPEDRDQYWEFRQ